jgi:hypothetical protein
MAIDGRPGPTITADVGDQIAEMYLARDDKGKKLYSTADITAQLHVPQSTIYWELQRRGIVPNRMNRRHGPGEPTLEELLRQVRELEGENSALQLQLEREKAINDVLLKQLLDAGIKPRRVRHKK